MFWFFTNVFCEIYIAVVFKNEFWWINPFAIFMKRCMELFQWWNVGRRKRFVPKSSVSSKWKHKQLHEDIFMMYISFIHELVEFKQVLSRIVFHISSKFRKDIFPNFNFWNIVWKTIKICKVWRSKPCRNMRDEQIRHFEISGVASESCKVFEPRSHQVNDHNQLNAYPLFTIKE